MAKNPSLTIDVHSEQFKAFTKQFKDLTALMQGMNQKWKALSDSINKTTGHIDRVTKSIQTAHKHLADFSGTTTKITKSIAKWGGMVGGIITMLGGGAFLGMDRIAQRMVDQRRRLLGLGGADYGRTQAIETFGKGLLGDPKGALSNIAKAKADITSDQYRALISKGISPEDIRAKKPEDLLMDFLKRTSKERMEGPLTLPHAKAFKETSILSEEDAIRLHGKEGQGLVDALEKRFKAAGGLQDKDLKAWEKFWESVTNFKTKIDTEWIKALEPLAPAGSKLIEALTNMTTSIAKWVETSGAIERIAKGIEWMANFMEQPSWKQAWESLKDLILWLMPKGPALTINGVPVVPGPGEAATNIQNKFGQFGVGTGGGGTTYSPAQDPMGAGASVAAPPATTQAAPSASGRGGVSPFLPGGSSSSFLPLIPPAVGSGRFGAGAGSLPGAQPAPFSFGAPSPTGGPRAAGGGASKFASAASSMSPRSGGSAISSISNTVLAGLGGGGGGAGGGHGGMGPLDANNWQSNRVASLVVRNVPGANIFMSAAGMTG